MVCTIECAQSSDAVTTSTVAHMDTVDSELLWWRYFAAAFAVHAVNPLR
jgi:hypothetical protein